MYNLTKCALCGNEAELELSHTVPKMAVRTLKKTAIGNIRSTENPNKTIQDSEKLYMLCGDCEDLFRTISGNPRQFNYRDESVELCISAHGNNIIIL